MSWDEPPTDTIGSAVLNDLDLWLDQDGDCGAGACGEHVSASRVDNVEWNHPQKSSAGRLSGESASPPRLHHGAPRGAGVDSDTGRIHPESQGSTPTRRSSSGTAKTN